jgi:hypothetical protein
MRHFAKNRRLVTFETIVSAMPTIRDILTPEEAARIAHVVATLRQPSRVK